jgi:hypothetical protein
MPGGVGGGSREASPYPDWFDKKHKFEVIVGKSILSFEEDEEGRTPQTPP